MRRTLSCTTPNRYSPKSHHQYNSPNHCQNQQTRLNALLFFSPSLTCFLGSLRRMMRSHMQQPTAGLQILMLMLVQCLVMVQRRRSSDARSRVRRRRRRSSGYSRCHGGGGGGDVVGHQLQAVVGMRDNNDDAGTGFPKKNSKNLYLDKSEPFGFLYFL